MELRKNWRKLTTALSQFWHREAGPMNWKNPVRVTAYIGWEIFNGAAFLVGEWVRYGVRAGQIFLAIPPTVILFCGGVWFAVWSFVRRPFPALETVPLLDLLEYHNWLGGVPGNKGRILKMRAQLAGSVCVWKQVVALPLCVCLLASCSMRTVRVQNPVLSVGSSETELLRDLLSGKRIDASFTDGTRLEGRVKEIQEGLLRVDIDKSSGPNPAPRGLQDIPTDRISTVKFTRYQGNKRLLLGTLFFGGGYGLAVGIIEGREGYSGGRTAAAIGVWSAMTILGYLWGKKKDKQNVTLEIQRPEATGGP